MSGVSCKLPLTPKANTAWKVLVDSRVAGHDDFKACTLQELTDSQSFEAAFLSHFEERHVDEFKSLPPQFWPAGGDFSGIQGITYSFDEDFNTHPVLDYFNHEAADLVLKMTVTPWTVVKEADSAVHFTHDGETNTLQVKGLNNASMATKFWFGCQVIFGSRESVTAPPVVSRTCECKDCVSVSRNVLLELADAGVGIVLTGIDVARDAGIPIAGVHVFEMRAFL